MLKNGQTYFKNLSVHTARFLKYVYPFFNWNIQPIFGKNGFSGTANVLEDYFRFLEKSFLDIRMQKFWNYLLYPDLKIWESLPVVFRFKDCFFGKLSNF